jgi:hypothetical protein
MKVPDDILLKILSKLTVNDLNRTCKADKNIKMFCKAHKDYISYLILINHGYNVSVEEAVKTLLELYEIDDKLVTNVGTIWKALKKNKALALKVMIKQIELEMGGKIKSDKLWMSMLEKYTDNELADHFYDMFYITDQVLNPKERLQLMMRYVKWYLEGNKSLPQSIKNDFIADNMEFEMNMIEKTLSSLVDITNSNNIRLQMNAVTGRYQNIDEI